MVPVAEVLEGLSAGLATVLLPPALALALAGRGRAVRGGEVLPLVLLSVAVFFLAAGVLVRFAMPSAWTSPAACVLAFAACVTFSESPAGARAGHESGSVSWALVVLAACLALVAVADCVWIFGEQSWGLDGRPPHVVSPMQLDPQRNTNMAAAIARGENTLFLPEGALLYQVLWYRGAAAMLSLLPDSPTRYYQVGGLVIALGWVLYFSILSIAFEASGRKAVGAAPVLLLAALLLLDGRIDNSPPFAYLQRLAMGGGDVPLFFQYFSVKLLALTAPQHALFLVLFFGAAYVRHARPAARVARLLPLWGVLAGAAFVASPVLAAFAMPSYVAADALVSRLEGAGRVVRRVLAMAAVLVIAAALHWAVVGYPPQDLFGRTEAVTLKTAWVDGLAMPLRLLPFAPFQIAGVLGIAFVLLLVLWFRSQRRTTTTWVRGWVDTGIALSALVFLSWNVVITDPELRRHGSMVLVVAMSLVGGTLVLMQDRAVGRFRPLQVAVAALALVLFLDLRFVRSYTAEAATVVAQDIAWKDYFDANRFLRTLRPKGVVSASGEGLVLPIANEAAPALVPKLAVLAHQRLSGGGAALMQGTRRMGGLEAGDLNREWLGLARAAGFDTLVWGPVEELRWGYFGRRLLMEGAELLMQFGEVGVYRMPVLPADAGRLSQSALPSGAFASSVCTAYIRSVLRGSGVKVVSDPSGYVVRSGSLGAVQPGMHLGRDLGAASSAVRCDPGLLLARPPAEVAEAALRGRLALTSSMPVQQSSQGAAPGLHGPESVLDAASGAREVRYALTGWEREPWWQIDLGEEVEVAAIEVDRGDLPPPYGVQHFAVILSDKPFPNLVADPFKPGTGSFFVDGDWPRNRPFATGGARGRYLRVQLAGEGALSLGAVRLWSGTR